MSKAIIKPLGRFCAVDEEGYFINEADVKKIQPPFLEAVQDAVAFYQAFFGEQLHSLYIRGTVARGVAIEETSDLDFIVVTYRAFPQEERLALNQGVEREVASKHPCVDGIETVVMELEEMLNTSVFSMVAFLLKTQSACVSGTNLMPLLPSYRCDLDLARDPIVHFKEHLQTALEDLQIAQVEEEEAETKDICRWIMKIIVRTGLALVMEQERVYTRDLYPAYQAFCRHFPEKQPEMEKALELAIQPSVDAGVLSDFLSSFGGWMAERAEAWMEVHPS